MLFSLLHSKREFQNNKQQFFHKAHKVYGTALSQIVSDI